MRERPVEPSDLHSLLALAPRLSEGVAAWRDQRKVLAAAEGWVTASVQDSHAGLSAVFVAERDLRVVGCIGVAARRHFTGDKDAYIGELAVCPSAARKGVGTELVAAAPAWGRAQGLVRVTLDTGAANVAARSFYARLGFQEEDVRLSRDLSG